MQDLSNEADALNQAIADEAPVMPDAQTGEVRLLRGLYDSDQDTWHDVAYVRELTGADEEKLADIGARPDITLNSYMGEVLKLGVNTIGDINVQAIPGAIDKLIMADRDMLYLGITKKTYGKTREFRVTCGVCGTDNDVEIDLDEDFAIIKPEGFDPKAPIEVETSKGTVLMRLPTGETTELATTIKDGHAPSAPEINTFLLAAGVQDEELADLADAQKWARNLNMGDRKKLVKALAVELGPNLEEVNARCSECDETMNILLDWVSLLLS